MGALAQLGQGQRPKARDLLLTPKNINRLAEQLARMRGAAMKIGQLVSMDSGEVLPPELAQIMARLRDDAHFMPPAQLKRVLNAQWPASWLSAFRKFDVRPIAAASIGQVHRAQLKDGRDLAIKVQYPGVARSIDADVANVGALMRMSGLLPKGFAIAPYLDEARKQLHDETDYAREGASLAQFSQLMEGSNRFKVPEFHTDWSTDSILAMSFVKGVPIERTVDQSQELRDAIAADLIELTLREIFDFRLMQTDPNFANYLYDPEADQIVLLDFGAARVLDDALVTQYGDLFRHGLTDDVDGLIAVSEALGFVSPDVPDPFLDEIIAMIRMVFAALRDTRPFEFADDTLSAQMQRRGEALASAGFVPPPIPIDTLLLQRKFGGMFLLAKRLRARVDVTEIIERYI